MAYSRPIKRAVGYLIKKADWDEFVENFWSTAPDLFTAGGQILYASAANVGVAGWPGIVQGGRLTLTSGTPVTISDVVDAGMLYYTPCLHDRTWLYTDSYWQPYNFTEKSLDISGYTELKNYDIYLYDNLGTLTMEGLAWTNATTRATAIALQNGRYVKSGAATRLYLGTICMSSVAGDCDDSVLFRGVWNYYNRVWRNLAFDEATGSWTYDTATWRQMRATAANKVEFVIGVSEDKVVVHNRVGVLLHNAESAFVSIGLDSTSAVATDAGMAVYKSVGNNGFFSLCAEYDGCPDAGYHYLAAIEYTDAGIPDFYGGSYQQFAGGLWG